MALLDRLRGRRALELLRPHEAAVLEALAGALPDAGAALLWQQVGQTERVQRLFSGTDVSLYPPAGQRGRSGPFSFPARPTELRLATVRLAMAGGVTIRARVDTVHGTVFSISFSGPPSPAMQVTGVTLHADPMDPAAGRPGEAGSPLGSLPPDALAEYRLLAATGAAGPEGEAGLVAADAVYGIDTALGSLVVVGAVATDLVVVRVDDGAVFRVSTDGDEERFGSIAAALSSAG
jgi:hypothetical protein